MPKVIAELTELIAQFPGIGPRQARRVVQFLLRANPDYKRKLTEGITTLSVRVTQCKKCQRFAETNAEGVCALCADETRDRKTLMVVEKDVDIEGIESAGIFYGMYFVLGALMPLTKRKTAVEPRLALLMKRLEEKEVSEVVLAFATTPEGDFTAQEVKMEIEKRVPGSTVTVLGRGLSLGAEIEYADSETLRSAFRGRRGDF